MGDCWHVAGSSTGANGLRAPAPRDCGPSLQVLPGPQLPKRPAAVLACAHSPSEAVLVAAVGSNLSWQLVLMQATHSGVTFGA